MNKYIFSGLQILFILLVFPLGPVAAESEDTGFLVEEVASGLNRPWALAFLPDGSMLVTLKEGGLVWLSGGPARMVDGLPGIDSSGQGGLLDAAVHPDFNENRLVYFTFSEGPAGRQGTSVARAVFRGGPEPRIENWEIIFSGNNITSGGLHFGSRMAFGPDGMLYVTIGERGQRNRAQDPFDHGGTVVRLIEDGGIPEDNPFTDGVGGHPAVFTYGHRNAQGLAVEPETGRAWLHEHGPKGGDEVNILKAGANYGWPVITHGREYSGARVGEGLTEKPGMEQPVLYWTPSIAPSGMTFYTGDAFPSWKGDLFVGALAGKQLRRIDIAKGNVAGQEVLLENNLGRIRDVRTGPDGFLYLLTDGPSASLYRLVPAD